MLQLFVNDTTVAELPFARFISKFGTHIIVGVKMGGKDVIYMKQQHSSSLQPADVQKRLKVMADKRFLDANGQNELGSEQVYQSEKVCTSFSLFTYDLRKYPILN